MEKLVVLDFSHNVVHIHPIEKGNYPDDEYIESIGYDSSSCLYMAGNIEIVKHKRVLK